LVVKKKAIQIKKMIQIKKILNYLMLVKNMEMELLEEFRQLMTKPLVVILAST
jgi:hypothetical protein